MTTTQTPAADDRVINSQASMDAVTLRVGDLETMSSYYSDSFAMEPLDERTTRTEVHRVLGRGDTPLVRLIHQPDLPAGNPRDAGLFHTAFLFDDQPALAATVFRAAQHPLAKFVGSSDHLVSEAFYFTDPEGNGIELYRDRPRDAWKRERGQIMMDTTWLDPNAFLREHLDQETVDAGPAIAGRVGHVHLQVGDIPTARRFYVDGIGFEPTLSEYNGALFTSAGGYHHHVAMNTWNSAGAGPRAAALGLGNVEVTVPSRADLDALITRLRSIGVQYTDDGRSVSAKDPWGTLVTVALPGMTVDESLARG